jgi:hypothetical protein
MNLRARRIFEKLLEMAKHDAFLSSSPSKMLLERAVEKGEPIPKKALPGALLDRLTDEERRELEALTTEDLTTTVWVSLNSIFNKERKT